MLKQTALLVSLLAGLHLIVGELVRAGLLDAGNTATGWIEPLSRLVLTPPPTTGLLVLVLSLSVLGILFFLERTKRKAPPTAPWTRTPRARIRQKQVSRPRRRPQDRSTITKDRIDVAEEWNNLDEADKEAIRAIASQGGLWETDITALLQARGFLHHRATLDSLAERVSFVNCDYASYYSIPPEYQALLDGVLAKDYADDSL